MPIHCFEVLKIPIGNDRSRYAYMQGYHLPINIAYSATVQSIVRTKFLPDTMEDHEYTNKQTNRNTSYKYTDLSFQIIKNKLRGYKC